MLFLLYYNGIIAMSQMKWHNWFLLNHSSRLGILLDQTRDYSHQARTGHLAVLANARWADAHLGRYTFFWGRVR